MTTIYKILRAAEWQEAERDGAFRGSPDDKRDGFIHFSTAEQTPGTYEKYFSGEPGLMLAAIDARRTGHGAEMGAVTRRCAVPASLRRFAFDGGAVVASAFLDQRTSNSFRNSSPSLHRVSATADSFSHQHAPGLHVIGVWHREQRTIIDLAFPLSKIVRFQPAIDSNPALAYLDTASLSHL